MIYVVSIANIFFFKLYHLKINIYIYIITQKTIQAKPLKFINPNIKAKVINYWEYVSIHSERLEFLAVIRITYTICH